MPLYRNGQRAEDLWIVIPDDEQVPETGPVIVGKARLIEDAVTLFQRSGSNGLVLKPGQTLEGLEAAIPRLKLIAIVIGRYTDGRGYSLARLLRDRYRFAGELRATGDVLTDQIGLLLRAGFDTIEVNDAATIRALDERRVVAVRHHYQSASPSVPERKLPSRPWLSVSEPL